MNDVPLLVEAQKAAERGYEFVIVVEAPRDLRLDRLEGRGLTREDAEARMAAQATDEERRAIATHLLDNGGDPGAPRGPGRRRSGPTCSAAQAEKTPRTPPRQKPPNSGK